MHGRAPVGLAVGAALALCLACNVGQAAGPLRLGHVDVLVFAPHPDDEVIGAGGVLQQALAAGKTVRVVFVTNGDGYPDAASALFDKAIGELGHPDYIRLGATRQREAVAADRLLGVTASSLVFLGYPDGDLAGVYADVTDAPLQAPLTGLTSTYGPALSDFHTLAHGRAAPYTRRSALADVEEILRASSPTQVYVTTGADEHPDHSAGFDLVRDAIADTGFRGELRTYLVHSGPGLTWPWPIGATPQAAFASHTEGGATYPLGVAWPPPIRVPISSGQSAVKLRALAAHASQWDLPLEQIFLESFVKSEEVFWTA
jgi:LmbE family N-acetylglucosaminyl deacetylase